MIKVKIISGPKAGEVNLKPMRPQQLAYLAKNGWRWKVDWSTVPDGEELFEWAKYDMINKGMSALIRGATVEFLDFTWQAQSKEDVARIAQEIEDTIVYSGYNVGIKSDEEDRLVIGVHGTEHPVQ